MHVTHLPAALQREIGLEDLAVPSALEESPLYGAVPDELEEEDGDEEDDDDDDDDGDDDDDDDDDDEDDDTDPGA